LQAQIPESISNLDVATIIKDARDLLEQDLSSMGAENIEELENELEECMQEREREFDALTSLMGPSEIDDNEFEGELAQHAEENDNAERVGGHHPDKGCSPSPS
jgi:hypothetical protein